MEIRKILLPTDFSECAREALTQAIFLANRHNAELHLLHVIVLHNDDPFNPAYHFPDSEEIFRHLCKIAQSEMRKLLDEEQGKVLKVREHQVRALAAAPAIVEMAREEGFDLVIMGAHGRRGLRRFFLGSVAEEVVRLAPCPVLTTRALGRDPLRPIGRVVAPVDFSDESAVAVGVARELAHGYGAELDVVHVVEHPSFTHHYEPVYNRAEEYSFPRMALKIEESLRSFLEEIDGPEVDVHLKVLEGDPSKAIIHHAEATDAGLIVMSTHGLTGLEHFLLGSVTEKVVRIADCPVLTLKAAPGDAQDD